MEVKDSKTTAQVPGIGIFAKTKETNVLLSSLEPKEKVTIGQNSDLPPVSETELKKIVKDMPKVDLHRHLEGSINPETMIRIARKYDIPLPTYDPKELAPLVQVTERDHTLIDFIKKFDTIGLLFKNEDAIKEITYQVIADANRDNVKYLELRFSPMYMAVRYNLSLEQVMNAVIKGTEEASKDFDTETKLIVIVERQMGTEKAKQVEELALDYKDRGVVGIDLANDELHFPPGPYAPIFRKAKEAGLGVTIHAGEAGGAENVKIAVEECKADRIGHGVHMADDPNVEEEVAALHIPVEVCPTSNVQTGAVTQLAKHPLKHFIDKGIPVVINTDDPGVSNITLTDEYLKVMNQFSLTLEQIQLMIINGVHAAFLPEYKKIALEKKFKERFASLNYIIKPDC